MHEFCHRCGGELPAGSGESPFCPHCGTPQLFLALENQSVETGGEPADGTASTGTLPPPRPQQVDWKTAIRSAALVAGIGSLLSFAGFHADVLSLVSFLWIMSASVITLAIYQKRKPAAWIDVRVGARIGVVVGVCLAVGLGIVAAGSGLVARFGLHSMGGFDAQMAQLQMQAVRTQMQQQPNAQLPAWWSGFANSPEFRAGAMLAVFGFLSACLLVMSTVGGAFAGLMRMRRRPAV